MAAFQMVFVLLTIISNGFVILMFVCKPFLITAFNISVMYLLASNLLYTIIDGPLGIVANLYSNWPLGRKWCNVHLFWTWVFVGFIVTGHLGIVLNRVWALFFPFHYRNYHSKKVAVLMVILLSSCVVILLTPVTVMDMVYYRGSEVEYGCVVNMEAQWLYTTILQIGFYDFINLFPMTMYPFLCYKFFSHARFRARITQKPGELPGGKCRK